MKKKIFGVVTAIAIAATVAFSMNINTDANEFSALTMNNIEALASGESGDCNYTNGYKAFKKSSGGAYNCCKIWVAKEPNTNEVCM